MGLGRAPRRERAAHWKDEEMVVWLARRREGGLVPPLREWGSSGLVADHGHERKTPEGAPGV